MVTRGKVVWHRLKVSERWPDVRIATERAYRANGDGTVRGALAWKRGVSTAMAWQSYTLKPEFRTVAALEAFLTAEGFTRGSAPRATLAPSLSTVQRWDWDHGTCEAVDGCTVEPDGTCPHGAPSWTKVYRLI